jgi:pre-mRNA-splicing factor ATP-dependent RNA helicase DHX16
MKVKDEEEEEQQISSEEDNIEVRTTKVEVEDKERIKDIEERNEFAERLRARDEQNTKRKMDHQTQKMMEEAMSEIKEAEQLQLSEDKVNELLEVYLELKKFKLKIDKELGIVIG